MAFITTASTSASTLGESLHLHDVGVAQAGGHLGFPPEALGDVGWVRDLGQQHLHGIATGKAIVRRLVDLAHAASADQADHARSVREQHPRASGWRP